MRTIERPRFRFRKQAEDADEAQEMIAHAESARGMGQDNPWVCDPCGCTNTVQRGNCAYCGEARE